MATLLAPSESVLKHKLKDYVYEVSHSTGKKIYYRGYKQAFQQNLSPENVMGSSYLQAILVNIIGAHLYFNLDKRKYTIASNEAAVQFEQGKWRSLDVAVFVKMDTLEMDKLKYASIAPKVVIEVDTKADLSNYDGKFMKYAIEKIEELFHFGTEKVIWISTEEQKILYAVPNDDWRFFDWTKSFEVLDGYHLNIADLIKELE